MVLIEMHHLLEKEFHYLSLLKSACIEAIQQVSHMYKHNRVADVVSSDLDDILSDDYENTVIFSPHKVGNEQHGSGLVYVKVHICASLAPFGTTLSDILKLKLVEAVKKLRTTPFKLMVFVDVAHPQSGFAVYNGRTGYENNPYDPLYRL